jgi:hypothetical protein
LTPHVTDIIMKNFSTVGARFVIAALVAGFGATSAQAASCAFLPNAPDQHKVVKGDTLWDISGRFLEHPWCWGQVWGLNREEIRNPHWIYPGQIVYFDRKNGRLSLNPNGAGDAGNGQVTRLSPRVRSADASNDALSSINFAAIEPFLSRPLVVEENDMATAPRIVATQGDHVVIGKNDKAYVSGDLGGATAFYVYRPRQPLRDPETNAVLGYEAFYLGSAKLRAAPTGDTNVSTVVLTSSVEEIGAGDLLVAQVPTPYINYAPHAPLEPVSGRVMSIYGGVTHAGQNQVVSVNRGSVDGLDIGATLQLYHAGRLVADQTENQGSSTKQFKLPDEQYGDLFIFRVFDHVSYGLIMQVTEPTEVGDVAKSPE